MDSMELFSEEMRVIQGRKPVILGEFGSFRHVDEDFSEASENLLSIRDPAIKNHMMGVMMWTYTTFEQERLYPAMEARGTF
jgi:hypothetical protein